MEAHSKFKACTQQTGVTSCQVSSYHFIRTSSKYNFQKWLSLNFDNCCLTQSEIKWFHLKYSILFNISLLRTFCTIQNIFIEIKFFVWKKLFLAKNPTYVQAFNFGARQNLYICTVIFRTVIVKNRNKSSKTVI